MVDALIIGTSNVGTSAAVLNVTSALADDNSCHRQLHSTVVGEGGGSNDTTLRHHQQQQQQQHQVSDDPNSADNKSTDHLLYKAASSTVSVHSGSNADRFVII